MSFDIFFQPCRFEGAVVERMNPITRKAQPVAVSEPLDATELKAVKKILKRAKARGPDEFGCYAVEVDDGGEAEVLADDLQTGCSVAMRGMTADLCRFLFDLLKAGNWVMLPAMKDTVAITTAPEAMRGIPEDFPRVVVCKSVEELSVLLSAGFGTWEKYRDQIVGGDP